MVHNATHTRYILIPTYEVNDDESLLENFCYLGRYLKSFASISYIFLVLITAILNIAAIELKIAQIKYFGYKFNNRVILLLRSYGVNNRVGL